MIYQTQYYRTLFRLEGPLFACLVPWIIVLTLKELAWTSLIRPIYSKAYLLVIGNLLSGLGLSFLYDLLYPRIWPLKTNLEPSIRLLPLPKYTGAIIVCSLACVWALEVAQVFYFEGFPLLWLFQGGVQNYADYGIPSLNGAIHALFLCMTTALFVWQLESPSRMKKLFFIFCLLLPILLVNRALGIALALQIACCGLILRPQYRGRIWVSGAVILLLFILLGNLRTGMERLLLVYPPSEHLPEMLYPLLWIYAYIVTPFNNLNMNADIVEPLNAFHWQLQALLPKALHPILSGYGIGKGEGFDVDFPGQVHTFYYEPILDFGLLYAGALMLCAQALVLRSFYRLYADPSLYQLLLYAIFYQIMVLSIFCNFLLFPPIIFQVACLYLFKPNSATS